MGERFQIINKFMPDKDFTGCPVGINKGAILYDRLNSVCVLQLKFQNFSKLPIRKLELQVIYYDDKGNVFETKSSYTGNEKNDGCFGSDRVIELNCDNVLTLDINILKVVLDDSTVWEYAEKTKKFLMPQTKLLPILKRQITRDLGESVANNFSYLPIDSDEYWQCACGKANEGDICIKCGQKKEIVFDAINIQKIVTNLKKYLKEEEKQAKQKHIGKQKVVNLKNNTIKRTCKLFIYIIISFFVCWSVNKIVNEVSFYRAVWLLGNHKYSQAIEKFDRLPREAYENRIYSEIESESKNIFNRFQNETIDYQDACDYLKELQDYSDTKNIEVIDGKLNEAKDLNESRNQYDKGKEYGENGDYAKAIKAFKKVIEGDKNYEEAQKYVKEYTRTLDKNANLKLEQYKKSNDYKAALELISEIKGIVEDSKIDNYAEYFRAVKEGEDCLKNGVEYIHANLYNSPDFDSESGYYIESNRIIGSSRASVYDYYISTYSYSDSEYVVWVKIKCDGKFYWITT